MAITKEEHTSISSLIDESKETEEIARRLHECLKRDKGSFERMRALRREAGQSPSRPEEEPPLKTP
jgi:hypothetical protein